MIDALIGGKLHGKPEQRTGRSGRAFVRAQVRVPTGEDSVFVTAVAFSDHVQAALLALDDGVAVSLAGPLTPRAWTDREGAPRVGLDMIINELLTVHHAKRRRDAMAPHKPVSAQATSRPAAQHEAPAQDDFGDDWLDGADHHG